MRLSQLSLAVLVGLALTCGQAWAKDATPVTGEKKVHLQHAHRVSTLMGMKVRNANGDEVGKIDDLVIDPTDGRVRYAAVAVGGFLGIGERLFAVPWHVLSIRHDANHATYVYFDIDKDRLRKAPGFDKDHWPEMGNDKFGIDVDKYYGVTVKVHTPNG